MSKLKDMMLVVSTSLAVILGVVLSYLFQRRSERKLILDYYNDRRKRYDKRLKDNTDRINTAPIEELLKPGDYIKKD